MSSLLAGLEDLLAVAASFGAGALFAVYAVMTIARLSGQRVDPEEAALNARMVEMDAPFTVAAVRQSCLGAGVGLAILFLTLWSHVVFAVISLIAAFTVIRMYPGWVERRYLRNVEKDLAGCLDIWVRCLRAGMSMQQAVEVAAQDLHGPVQREMIKVQQDIRLSDIDTALWRWHDRLPMEDVRYTVLGVIICRQTGGKMSDVMENINASVHQRIEMREKVGALTAMGRTEAIAMAVMPAIICILTYLMEPDMIRNLFFTAAGIIGTIAMLCWEALGVYIIWKIVNVKF